MKQLMISGSGDIHFGQVPMDGFQPAGMDEAEKALGALGSRRIWRCTVCNDLYVGEAPPKVCPTCSATDAYVEINGKEFMGMIN